MVGQRYLSASVTSSRVWRWTNRSSQSVDGATVTGRSGLARLPPADGDERSGRLPSSPLGVADDAALQGCLAAAAVDVDVDVGRTRRIASLNMLSVMRGRWLAAAAAAGALDVTDPAAVADATSICSTNRYDSSLPKFTLADISRRHKKYRRHLSATFLCRRHLSANVNRRLCGSTTTNGLRFHWDSTSVRLPYNCNSTMRQPTLRRCVYLCACVRAAALRPK